MIEIQKALQYESIVISGLLHRSGVWNELQGRIWAAFGFVTAPKRKRLQELGLSKMHEVLDFSEIAQASIRANHLINQVSMKVTRQIAMNGLGYKKPFYINRYPVTRFFAPFDVLNTHEQSEGHRQNKQSCCGKAVDGMIRFHGPHRDSWHGTALNNFNFWAALTDFDEENSMFIYPEYLGKPVQHRDVFIEQAESFGAPQTFSGKAGDVLLFHSDHLHGTQLNITGNTRIVITFRLAFDTPRFSADGGKKQRYFDSRYIGTPLEKFKVEPPIFSFNLNAFPSRKKHVLR